MEDPRPVDYLLMSVYFVILCGFWLWVGLKVFS